MRLLLILRVHWLDAACCWHEWRRHHDRTRHPGGSPERERWLAAVRAHASAVARLCAFDRARGAPSQREHHDGRQDVSCSALPDRRERALPVRPCVEQPSHRQAHNEQHAEHHGPPVPVDQPPVRPDHALALVGGHGVGEDQTARDQVWTDHGQRLLDAEIPSAGPSPSTRGDTGPSDWVHGQWELDGSRVTAHGDSVRTTGHGGQVRR